MKPRIVLLFLLVVGFGFAQAADDLSAFGVNTDAAMSKKLKFEDAMAGKIQEQLAQFYAKDDFQVYVEVKLNNKKQATVSSSQLQLGMLGTIANMSPPRQQTTGSKFIDRIEELKIVLYVIDDIDTGMQAKMIELAKAQISFLPSKIVISEIKPLARPRQFSFAFIKDFQVLWSALFLAFVFMFGFRYLAQQLPQQISEVYLASLPAPRSHNVELLEAPGARTPALHQTVLTEDHFFKLPIAVQQTVIGFASLGTLQEVYTLLSPKYKKLFWSCLPKDLQILPEGHMMKQGCVVQDIESSEGWSVLSKDVHTYVQRNSELVATFHPDVKFYFKSNWSRRNENAS